MKKSRIATPKFLAERIGLEPMDREITVTD